MTQGQFPYLHGFSSDEQERLKKQAEFLEPIVHKDVNFSPRSSVLEIGCGVGAQSEILLRRNPTLKLTGLDLSEAQLAVAKKNLSELSYANNRFELIQGSAENLSFESNSFDGIFLCWTLEHVPDPKRVLSEARRVLRSGGEIIITEVMNSSFFLDPYGPNVWKYWMAFNDHQYDIGGDPFVGAKLGNFLHSEGFREIQTEVKVIHYDKRHSDKRKEMIEFWTELLLSGAQELIQAKKVSEEVVEEVRAELALVARDPNAVFHYTAMQAKARC